PGGRDRPVVVDSFALQSGDVIIVGTDGRDDLCIGTDERGFQIVNENEELFLEVVQESAGNLERIHEELLQRGDLMDDLALIRIQYDR
ncbi:MAG: SpoIIE family protein phosphatase, partial [Leptospiraceae bacterium]|nr:SpoIIE family protein phosphatase [Leptospiraceae bacterium]